MDRVRYEGKRGYNWNECHGLTEKAARKSNWQAFGDVYAISDAICPHIRAMIAAAGKEAVIPPRSHQWRLAVHDKEKYKKRNQAVRLCDKIKRYRGVATRYDKLAAVFLGSVFAPLLGICPQCIVRTP